MKELTLTGTSEGAISTVNQLEYFLQSMLISTKPVWHGHGVIVGVHTPKANTKWGQERTSAYATSEDIYMYYYSWLWGWGEGTWVGGHVIEYRCVRPTYLKPASPQHNTYLPTHRRESWKTRKESTTNTDSYYAQTFRLARSNDHVQHVFSLN